MFDNCFQEIFLFLRIKNKKNMFDKQKLLFIFCS